MPFHARAPAHHDVFNLVCLRFPSPPLWSRSWSSLRRMPACGISSSVDKFFQPISLKDSSFCTTLSFSQSQELFEEAHVVFIEQAQVVDVVAPHDHALQAHAEARSRCIPPGRCRSWRAPSGCTMPQPRISIQPSPLHRRQPSPWQLKHCTSTSALGSVKGKWCGRKRTTESSPYRRFDEQFPACPSDRLKVMPFVHHKALDLVEERGVGGVHRVGAVDTAGGR